MTRKFTEEETLRLVQLYRQHECLWDIRSKEYKNKHMRIAALKQIRDAMDIEGFNVDDIKTKIKIIRSAYYLELNKIEKSTRSGAGNVYVPRVKWFNELNSFIKTVTSRRPTPSLTESNEENESGTSMTVQVAPQCLIPTPPARIKRKLSQRFVKRLKPKQNDVPRTEEQSDYDLFGKIVSSQLKKLSEEQAAIAQEKIQSILTQCKLADIAARKSNSVVPLHSPLFTQSMHHDCTRYQSNYQPLKNSPTDTSPVITSSFTFKNSSNDATNPDSDISEAST